MWCVFCLLENARFLYFRAFFTRDHQVCMYYLLTLIAEGWVKDAN